MPKTKRTSPNIFCNEPQCQHDHEVRGSSSAEGDGESTSTNTTPSLKRRRKECHCEEICKAFKDELCSLFKDLKTDENQSEETQTSVEIEEAKNDVITKKMNQLDIENPENLEHQTLEEKNKQTKDNLEQQNPSATLESGSLLAAALPRIVATHTATSSTSSATVTSAPPASSPHDDEIMRDGPPTPTHSENIDPHAPPLHLEQALPRKMESLGCYSSVVGSLQQPALILTPSLAALARPELTAHVAAWPADLLEKQALKYTEEAYQLGCLQSTRVAAELKCSRSLVRHTEIRATLQEQKIMYLRQQIARLDELKTHNSFMSDD